MYNDSIYWLDLSSSNGSGLKLNRGAKMAFLHKALDALFQIRLSAGAVTMQPSTTCLFEYYLSRIFFSCFKIEGKQKIELESCMSSLLRVHSIDLNPADQ